MIDFQKKRLIRSIYLYSQTKKNFFFKPFLENMGLKKKKKKKKRKKKKKKKKKRVKGRLTPTVDAWHIDSGDLGEHDLVFGSWKAEFIIVLVKNILDPDIGGPCVGR